LDIAEVLGRLSGYISEFDKTKDFNCSRKAAEAISRIILLNSPDVSVQAKAEATKLNVLIDSLTNENVKIEQNHLKKIKMDLNGIQTFGNILSHDNSYVISAEDISRLELNIDQLLRSVFDSRELVNIDQKLPPYIYQKIHKLILGDEDWRCEKIINIVYPNRARISKFTEKDFELHIIKDVDTRIVGLLFLGRNICFQQTIEDVFKLSEVKNLSTLTVLFPTEISKATGKAVKHRKVYIERLTKEFSNRLPSLTLSHEFIEDYIWDRCLPDSVKSVDSYSGEPYFIDQNLHASNASYLSLEFVDSIVKNSLPSKKPIYVVFGDGGAGKTTFCEEAVAKINQYQGKGLKKKAILLSSFDVPDDISNNGVKIDSLESLYALTVGSDENSINPANLALNISSGNLVIVVDGLDEIQAKLKERFALDDFLDSVSDLNDTYLNCSVIITSREIDKASFERPDVSIFYIKGFNEELVEKYLEKRFRRDFAAIARAKDYVSQFSHNSETTPLIIRLVSELATEVNANKKILIPSDKYFQKDQILDKVVFQLIDREVTTKQVLPISVDQYFEFLKDIVFEYGGRATKEEFNLLIEVAIAGSTGPAKIRDFENLHLSTLLRRDGECVKIKYDSLELWIKSRYLTYLFKRGHKENDINVIKTIAQNCYKGGVLVEEIAKFKPNDFIYESTVIKQWLPNIESGIDEALFRKLISALLYIAFEGTHGDRAEKSNKILEIFDQDASGKISGLSIFGAFYPLDFSIFSVRKGYFSSYSNFSKSHIPPGRVTFYSTEIVGVEKEDFGRGIATRENFDSECVLCQELNDIIDSDTENKEKLQANIRSDLQKIFRVGFKSGNFVWKSDSLYKQQCSTLKSKLGLSNYLFSLEREGFINSMAATGSPGQGFMVSESVRLDVKDFLTQSILSSKMHTLLQKLTGL
jgi:hypothetical protein